MTVLRNEKDLIHEVNELLSSPFFTFKWEGEINESVY